MRSIGSQIWNPFRDYQFRCAVYWFTVLIETGSPLIRIMVKSIPGTAQGSVHASVYKSEANSNVLQRSRQNIETGCSKEDRGDQMEEPNRNKGGKADDAEKGPWFKTNLSLYFYIYFVLIHQASRMQPRLDQMLTP